MQPKNQTASRISAIHITILIQIPPSATENTGETASPPPSAPGSIQNPGSGTPAPPGASPGTPHPPSTGGRYTPPGRSPEDFLQNVADALLPDHGSRLRTHQLRLPPGLERQKAFLPACTGSKAYRNTPVPGRWGNTHKPPDAPPPRPGEGQNRPWAHRKTTPPADC